VASETSSIRDNPLDSDNLVFDQAERPTFLQSLLEVSLLVLIFFAYAGDPPPMVNESHYLVKAKNYWDPTWCAVDLLAASAKDHVVFYATFGWLTKFVSLEATAWIGRVIGWTLLAIGLRRLSWSLFRRPYLSLLIAPVWIIGIEYGNLAGEWVVGGIEGKVPAYGFVLIALSELIERRWTRVWPWLGVASAFHVLTGGWSVVAASLAWFLTARRRDDRRPFFCAGLFFGGAIAMLGLVPALALSSGVDSADGTAAARIYTYYRIAHHLLPSALLTSWYVRHGIMLVFTLAAAYAYRQHMGIRFLTAFTLGAVLIAIIGLALGRLPAYEPDLAARLLRFYWFRLSDAVVPLLTGAVVAQMCLDQRAWLRHAASGLVVGCALLVAASSLQTIALRIPPGCSNGLLGFDVGASAERQQQVYRDWLAVCRWAKASSEPDEVFLTPRHQQSFKWYAERGEVVNWKDVPQDVTSLLEWQRRFREIFPQRLGFKRVTIQYPQLREYRKRYGVRWMIVDRRIVGDDLPLVRVYPLEPETNATYAVYELPD
jgi:hypothetical protein